MANAKDSTGRTRFDDFEALLLIQTDECVEWPYGGTARGYGQVKDRQGRLRLTHRLALQIATGESGDGMDAAHGPCNNRRCMNTRHLSWKTQLENHADTVRDGTRVWGERSHLAKLTEADVLEIRASSETGVAIAKRFGIRQQNVSEIRRRKTWTFI